MEVELFKNEYRTPKELLNVLLQKRRERTLVFRGISRSIEIKPKIQRVYNSYENEVQNLAYAEYSMLDDFVKMGKLHFGLNFDILDYVATAQHFGLPTRLIDWTRDPFVALFFAVISNNKPDNGEYTIYYTDLKNHTVIDRPYNGLTYMEMESSSEFIIKYFNFLNYLDDKKRLNKNIEERNRFFKKIGVNTTTQFKNDGLIFFDPPSSNLRLIAQQGLFSIPISIEGEVATLEFEKYTKSFKLILSSEDRKVLIDYLENMNYTTQRLFPDLASISSSIIAKYHL